MAASDEDRGALEETRDILRDGAPLQSLKDSEEDVRAGRVVRLRDVKRELGLGRAES